MAFPIGKGRNEQGTFQQITFIFTTRNTYTGKAMKTIIHVCKETKALQPTTSSDQFTALTQFYLWTRHHQQSLKRKEKATLKRRGWQTGSVDLYVA